MTDCTIIPYTESKVVGTDFCLKKHSDAEFPCHQWNITLYGVYNLANPKRKREALQCQWHYNLISCTVWEHWTHHEMLHCGLSFSTTSFVCSVILIFCLSLIPALPLSLSHTHTLSPWQCSLYCRHMKVIERSSKYSLWWVLMVGIKEDGCSWCQHCRCLLLWPPRSLVPQAVSHYQPESSRASKSPTYIQWSEGCVI